MAIVGPGAGDSPFVDGTRFSVEEKRELRDVGLSAVHPDVALRLLLGIIERVGVKKRPDELAADVFESEFKMSMLINSVVAAEKSGGADVEALFVVNFLRIDETRRVTSARGGDGRVKRVRESVAKSDARWSGLDEFGGVPGMEHARLSGHCA